MTVMVQPEFPELYEADQKTGRPASSLRIAHRSAVGINHAAGYLLGGLRVWNACDPGCSDTSGTHRYKTYRHSNCDHLWVVVTYRNVIQDGATIVVTAGTGAAQTFTFTGVAPLVTAEGTITFRCPFAGGDNGVVDLTLALTDIGLLNIAVWDLIRPTLDWSADNCIEDRDSTYPRVGLREGDCIAESTEAGVKGLATQLRNCWDDYKRQAVNWSDIGGITGWAGAGWVNPFGSDNAFPFRHQARQKTSSDETTAYTCYSYTKCDAGDQYEIRITSSNPGPAASSTITSGSLTNTAYAWQTLSTLLVDCTTDTALTWEGRLTSGAGDIDIAALAILEV